MKKAGYEVRAWHRIRSQNQFKRTHERGFSKPSREQHHRRRNNYHTNSVRIWQGGDPEMAICTRPKIDAPEALCFRENLNETARFLDGVRRNFIMAINRGSGGFVRRRSERSIPRINGYSDFSKISKISMPAAVVVAAEYDRLSETLKEVPPTVNLHDWDPIVVTRLHQLGFFSILGHSPDPSVLQLDGDFMLMKIIRSQNSETLNEVDDALMELGAFLSLDSDKLDETVTHTLSIISEVMSNVTQHAYGENVDYTYRHIDSFWISAEANRANRTLRIVLYDQGATIPATYQSLNRTDKVKKFLRRALRKEPEFDYADDGTYIRAALRYGGSRTELDYRGKGFPQMSDLLDTLGGGELGIYSRGGWCTRDCNGKIRSDSHDCSIGGTLVEWKLEL